MAVSSRLIRLLIIVPNLRLLQLQKLPMKVGDIVLSHRNLCVLKSIGGNDNCGAEGPSCVLTFSAGDITQEYSYRCVFGKGDGNDRL
jgi:hypothetical protein